MRPQTAAGRTNHGMKSGVKKKPVSKKILEKNWNPDTASAYGIRPHRDQISPQKTHKNQDKRDQRAMSKTKNLREKSKESMQKLSALEKERLQKVDKQLNDEVSRAFEDMARILSKY